MVEQITSVESKQPVKPRRFLRRVVGIAGLGLASATMVPPAAQAASNLPSGDVKILQQDLNEDLVRYGMPKLTVDGKLGQLTQRGTCAQRYLAGQHNTRDVSRMTSNDVKILNNLDTLSVPKPLNLMMHELAHKTEYVDYAVINKTCQVMAIVLNNQLVAIIPVSTGSKDHETPEGVFFGEHARLGWHNSSDYPDEINEGNMLNTIYFNGKIGAHGSRDMQDGDTTPQSHGCIRLREYDSDIFYGLAGGRTDTPIDAYHEVSLAQPLPIVVLGEYEYDLAA